VGGIEATRAVVAELPRDRDVPLQVIDDDAFAKRALAHDQFVASEGFQNRDHDRVAGDDDIAPSRVHPRQFLALFRGETHHRSLQRAQTIEPQNVTVRPLAGGSRFCRVEGGEAEDGSRGSDQEIETIVGELVRDGGERRANVLIEGPRADRRRALVP
jgi:hypothetical protein